MFKAVIDIFLSQARASLSHTGKCRGGKSPLLAQCHVVVPISHKDHYRKEETTKTRGLSPQIPLGHCHGI